MKLQRSTLNSYLVEENVKYCYDVNVFVGLLTTAVCVYSGALQRRCVRLMRETTMQTFGGSTVFTVKIVGTFKKETRRVQKRVLTTLTCERKRVTLNWNKFILT